MVLAPGIRVFKSVEEVHEASTAYSPAARLLGGERHGQQIDGFDGDNSPRQYLRDLRGKTLLFTTTNGSKAAQFVKAAGCLVFGAFVNISACREAVAASAFGQVLLLCSGTGGAPPQAIACPKAGSARQCARRARAPRAQWWQ